MKKLLVMLLCATSMSAMFKEEEQPAENKMQLVFSQQEIYAHQLADIMKKHPRLHEIAVTDDPFLTDIRSDGIRLQELTSVNFTGCRLTHADTVSTLLRLAPLLQKCILARNELQGLSSTIGVDAQLPRHVYLTELDCSHNNITEVDFVALREKLPSLKRLNLAHNKTLKKFKTEGVRYIQNYVPEIDLRGTNLSEATKKEIIRNSQKSANSEFVCMIVGGFLGMGLSIPVLLLTTTKVSAALILGTTFGIAPAIGAVGSLPIALTATEPENRFATLYVPTFDDADYSDAETRSAYFRFVKNFPFIGNITRCCRAQDPDYEPLNVVEEKE